MSRFSVYRGGSLLATTKKKIGEHPMEGEGQVNIFQFQGILGAVARIERSSRCSGGRHDSLVSGIALVAELPERRDSRPRGGKSIVSQAGM